MDWILSFFSGNNSKKRQWRQREKKAIQVIMFCSKFFAAARTGLLQPVVVIGSCQNPISKTIYSGEKERGNNTWFANTWERLIANIECIYILLIMFSCLSRDNIDLCVFATQCHTASVSWKKHTKPCFIYSIIDIKPGLIDKLNVLLVLDFFYFPLLYENSKTVLYFCIFLNFFVVISIWYT